MYADVLVDIDELFRKWSCHSRWVNSPPAAVSGHAPNRNYSRPGYMGVDYLSNAVWVRCIKLLQGSMPMEYVSSLRCP